MIGILDYGLGNIRSFSNIYRSLNIPHKIISTNEDLIKVKKIILPGVGAFDTAMKKFNQSGLRDSVEEMVLNRNIPLLGVCVGLQMLGCSSDEGKEKGLGWIDGSIKIFDTSNITHVTKLPHMGWNTIEIKSNNELLFKNLNSKDRFYFLHSYYFECHNNDNIIAQTNYGLNFTCAVKLNNIYGVQFHPEKSLRNGEKLLHNFSQL